MKKLLFVLLDFLAVLTLSLLAASCGGGGGGGGSDYSEPSAATPVASEDNDRSSVNMSAPTYTDENLGITISSSNITAGDSVTFTAKAGYESYSWFVASLPKQEGASEKFVLDTSELSGPCELLLIVKDGETRHGGTFNFIVKTSAN